MASNQIGEENKQTNKTNPQQTHHIMLITFQEGQTEDSVKYCLEEVWKVEITFLVYWAKSNKGFWKYIKTIMFTWRLKVYAVIFMINCYWLNCFDPSCVFLLAEALGSCMNCFLHDFKHYIVLFSEQPSLSLQKLAWPLVSAAFRQQQPVSKDILITALHRKWGTSVGCGSKICQ